MVTGFTFSSKCAQVKFLPAYNSASCSFLWNYYNLCRHKNCS